MKNGEQRLSRGSDVDSSVDEQDQLNSGLLRRRQLCRQAWSVELGFG